MQRVSTILLLIALVGAGVSSASAQPSRITTKSEAEGYTVKMVGYDFADENQAQALIGPTVAKLCPAKQPRWGRFSLVRQTSGLSGKRLRPGRFEQRITCVDPVPVTVSEPTGSFVPTDADEANVKTVALRFLALRDGGNPEASLAMLAPSLRETTDQAEWRREVLAKPKLVGSGMMRSILRVTWYLDPPGVDPGVYAAADFEGKSSGLAIHCGYVALRRTVGSAIPGWAVVRIEEGRLLAASAARMDAAQIVAAHSTLQCR